MTVRMQVGRLWMLLMLGTTVAAAAQKPQRESSDRDRRTEATRSSSQGQRLRQTNPFGMWQPYRARTWSTERRTWTKRGGYSGYRIPDDRFRARFGPKNRFRMRSLPYVSIGGRPRMAFGGSTFSLVDPYPEYWSDNWYDQDDMYIDYWNDGYYLYNRNHPDDRIAIQVYVN